MGRRGVSPGSRGGFGRGGTRARISRSVVVACPSPISSPSLLCADAAVSLLDTLHAEVAEAVRWYWATRSGQRAKQQASAHSTRGRRADVLGGKHLDGFAVLVEDLLVEQGVPPDSVLHDYAATLPGYYRCTKRWDVAVVHEGQLLAAVEFKAIASSFGNNLNNRSEEAIGSSTDLFDAYEEGVFAPSPAPWVGYVLLMADTPKSTGAPVNVHEPRFPVEDAFREATYARRGELLCLRMARKRVVTAAAFLLSAPDAGLDGGYTEPNPELTFARFARSLVAHVTGHLG